MVSAQGSSMHERTVSYVNVMDGSRIITLISKHSSIRLEQQTMAREKCSAVACGSTGTMADPSGPLNAVRDKKVLTGGE